MPLNPVQGYSESPHWRYEAILNWLAACEDEPPGSPSHSRRSKRAFFTLADRYSNFSCRPGEVHPRKPFSKNMSSQAGSRRGSRARGRTQSRGTRTRASEVANEPIQKYVVHIDHAFLVHGADNLTGE